MIYLVLITLKLLLFIAMTRVSHQVVSVFLVSALIVSTLLLILYKFNPKRHHIVVFIFYSAISVLMFADVLYFTYFNRLLTFAVKSQISQLPSVLNVISFLIDQKVILFLIDLPIFLILFYRKRSFALRPLSVHQFYFKLTILVSLIALLQATYSDTVKAYEFFTYHTVDFFQQVINTNDDGFYLSKDQIESLQRNNEMITGPITGVAKGKNVVIVQLEALQNIAINLVVDNEEITPNLNRLIEDSGTIYFDNIYQSVGRGNTSDAEFVALNSLYASSSEITYETYFENTYYSLAHLLGDQGYRSAYFHANEGDFYNREVMAKQLGFDEFYEIDDYKFKENQIISYGLNDFDFYKQSAYRLQQLEKHNPQGWMAFMISLSSHTPFELDESIKTLDFGEEKNNIVYNYLESLHYADTALGEFLDDLKLKGLYDDTMFVFYGDHFGLNGFHDETKALTQEILGKPYYETDGLNVPLIIHIPNAQIHQTISKTGSQMDIYPTLINLLGLKNEKGIMFGQDLINSKRYNAAFPVFFVTESSFIDDDMIYLASRDNVLEHSKLIQRSTQEEIDVELIKEQLDKNERIIDFSHYLMEHDLLKQIVK